MHATKEVNAVTRQNAYDLLVQMGYKMEQGGVINRSLVEGHVTTAAAAAEAEGEAETTARWPKVVLCLLRSASTSPWLLPSRWYHPHMISATITALSRLVYEFKENLEQSVLDDLLSTIEVYVQSANREIVKSRHRLRPRSLLSTSTRPSSTHTCPSSSPH